MARRSTGKPWLHEKSGYWGTSVDRKRVYLDKDYRVANRKLRQLFAWAIRHDLSTENPLFGYESGKPKLTTWAMNPTSRCCGNSIRFTSK